MDAPGTLEIAAQCCTMQHATLDLGCSLWHGEHIRNTA